MSLIVAVTLGSVGGLGLGVALMMTNHDRFYGYRPRRECRLITLLSLLSFAGAISILIVDLSRIGG